MKYIKENDMKKNRVIVSIMLVCIALFSLCSCKDGGDSSTGTNANKSPITIVYDFSVKSTDFVVELGSTYILAAEYGNEQITFHVDDSSILSINEEGLITPLKKGITYITITATNTDKNVICKVTVSDGENYRVVFDDLGYEYELTVNASKRFSVKTYLGDVEYQDEITWSVENVSNNVTLTKVGNDCWFKASQQGTYVLKALSSKGGVATITVVVK